MSASADVARLHRKFDKVARELDGRALEAKLLELGKDASKFVDDAVRSTPAKNGTLGDGSMSGWRRNSPFKLDGAARAVKQGGKAQVVVSPSRRALGPMRVLEDGRKASTKGEFRVVGQRFSKKSGYLVDKRRRVKRSSGATEGKQTWTRATTVMARYVPIAGRRQFVTTWKKAMQ